MNRNILLIHHSISKTTSEKINDYFEKLILENTKFKLISIDEKSMQEKLSVLSKLILNCDVIFILVSLEFQRNKGLMEMVNYAKDIKAKLYSLNFFATYKPFGSLGAISVSSDKGVLQFNKENQFEQLMKDLVETIKGYKNDKKNDDEFVLRSITATVNLDFSSNEEPDVLISCHKNQLEIAELIKNSISSEERKCLIEDTSSTNLTCLKKSKALVVIISQDFESSFNCRALIECARSIDKKFVPVTVSREYKPAGWLGLAIAGKVFYRILNKEKAFTKKYDSTPMNDLKMAVLHALEPRSSNEERENAMIKSLEKAIEECKQNLGNKWPPKKRVREILEEKPVKVELSEPKATHEFFYTNYEVTRMDFNSVPKELFDGNGVPIMHKFDCMISYQWAKQDVVRNIYISLYERGNLKIWFDIWGNMQGNCNDSMSLAVECSKVIIVCLNDKYLTSENCKLEFKYSVYRGKPFIFILTEPNLKIESWLEPFYSEFPKFEIFNNEMCELLHNGVSRLDVISQAIREIEQAQPDINFELSSRVIELKNLLDDAMDDVAEMTNTQRFKECTRCKKKYEENNKSGCKKHSSYYVGGQIIEGRWSCCYQQKENSIGCHDTDHIDQARVWFQDPDYGTYTWKPE